MILVFDLDDTLYEEADYVRSGFRAVARFLSPILMVPPVVLEQEQLALLAQYGRGRIFDMLLERRGRYTKRLLRECIASYRCHEPDIRLYAESAACLRRFRQLPLYVVTDGNKVAQAAKVRALKLPRLVRRALLTHRHGVAHAKPSPYCFQLIQRLERAQPEEIVYVGDNPAKDFVGIRPLGFRTIRVLTGSHATMTARPGHDADVTIKSLDELTATLLGELVASPTRTD